MEAVLSFSLVVECVAATPVFPESRDLDVDRCSLKCLEVHIANVEMHQKREFGGQPGFFFHLYAPERWM